MRREKMGLAHCKGQAVALWVIASCVAHLSSNAVMMCGFNGADMDVSQATRRVNAARFAALKLIIINVIERGRRALRCRIATQHGRGMIARFISFTGCSPTPAPYLMKSWTLSNAEPLSRVIQKRTSGTQYRQCSWLMRLVTRRRGVHSESSETVVMLFFPLFFI